MYLVYLDKKYFGFTYSKKVVKLLKSIYPTAKAVPINPEITKNFEISEMTADHNKISIFELDDQEGNKQSVISTDIEQDNAVMWINRLIVEKVSFGSVASIEIFEQIPAKLRCLLGSYEPIDYLIADGKADDYYDLTYEGYLLYLKEGKEDQADERETDICML